MQRVEILYRPGPIVLATLGFALCAAWIALGPETSGAIGRTLGSRGEPSILGITAIGIGVVFTLMFGFHVARMMLGCPAIAVDDDTLFVNVLPFRKYRNSSISLIRCDETNLVIQLNDGRTRTVSTRLLKNAEISSQKLIRAING